ncbi:MAG: tonB-system energizer ExbB [Cycloclasticus sp.]
MIHRSGQDPIQRNTILFSLRRGSLISMAMAFTFFILPAQAQAVDSQLANNMVPSMVATSGPLDRDSNEEVLSQPPAITSPATTLSKPSPSTLPHDLSPWGMFLAADWVVKTVMIGLTIASLLTWTVLVAKSIELKLLKKRLQQTLSHFSNANTLDDAFKLHTLSGIGHELISAARAELQLSANITDPDKNKASIKERVMSSLSRIEITAGRQMLTGTGLLATIGSTAPFIGLFGTVWGIMNSFIGISQANTTSLAVVAPGIAEALLATAFGLVAAIPAVIIYNHFTRKITTAKVLVADSSAAVMRLLSRDLDRKENTPNKEL